MIISPKNIVSMKFSKILIFLLVTICTSSCVDEKSLPEIETKIESVDNNAITIGVSLLNDGNALIINKGVCYSLNSEPSILDINYSNDSATTNFSVVFSGLEAHTKYYFRAYATNSEGTSYGNEVSEMTLGEITDFDGNIYNTVKIHSTVWMVENLKTKHFNDGTEIPFIIEQRDWISLTNPGYCWYKNNEINYTNYGSLYNWYTVNSSKICPDGWHVPQDSEWKNFEREIGLSFDEADVIGWRGNDEAIQLRDTIGWSNNGNGENGYGFSALPGGYRSNLYGTTFYGLGAHGAWWTATESDTVEAFIRLLSADSTNIFRGSLDKRDGLSIRCIRD